MAGVERSNDSQIPSRVIQTGTNETNLYKLIDMEKDIEIAIEELKTDIRQNKLLAVDCEGVDLSRRGSITLIAIATKRMVYMFDILKLGKSAFDKGLRCILEDVSVDKLMFDCREDSDALFHLFDVKLNSVLDIQLLDLMRRGERKLRSLVHCIDLYVRDLKTTAIKKKGRLLLELSKVIWELRPLTQDMLEYASVDVLALFKLFDRLRCDKTTMDRLRIASTRYCDCIRSQRSRSFARSGFIPAGILC